ncbi:alpha-galactosidase [Bifidobacterium avesanii]|uniref:alpha-galactosidase n=1 Tax=Bifidobacterium avesanii TaxID=1798157 RepID=A0A7K3TJ07_9BIFI|nr:alpha-galactosidase [Bifidobacterium avesanii]KAB8292059.1 alpha-galactosidase [Bifidobacterium avesanii]NEG78580.1 alpha-galactosidase [Bifidobacterium avesanii]
MADTNPIVSRFTGTAHDGEPVAAVYLADPQSGAALGLAFHGGELPRIIHWGRPLAAPETLLDAYDALNPQRVSGALDCTPWPSVMPTQAESWIGEPRLVLRRGGVEIFPKFTVTGIELSDGGSDDDPGAVDVTVDFDSSTGPQTVTDASGRTRTTGPSEVPGVIVHAEDAELGVGLDWQAQIVPGGLMRQRATVRNLFGGGDDHADRGADRGAEPLEIGKVELGFPVPATATEILTATGHHLRERSPQRQPFTVGRFAKPQLAGRPDFDASLLLTAGVPGFDFTHGEAYAVHVAWSGNSELSAERLPYTQGVIGGGEALFGGEITLGGPSGEAAVQSAPPAQSYETPWLYGSFGDGLNEIAARFHEYVRSRHPRLFAHGRPVILNTWEAVYFQHDFDTLKALADKAAASGVERFVVDDGWFGSRRDDTSGLGDWQIAQDVWPDGPKSLKALADYVHGLGMQFGLWFEPEMVNPDSDTARAHPDWILAPAPGRLPMQGRSQQVLDLTNPDAFAYIFGAMDGLVSELGIDYIKWDHNKLVTEAVSPRTGKPAVHAQTLAVYRIFRDLIRSHPGLEIESCSSGGGRVDLGILEYASRIWASDCVDPVERADIQRYTSLLVPPAMIGEHVGASPAHSTHRATSQELRMAMAFFGHMGIEWNLLKEPEAALDELAVWVDEYKRHRDWFVGGTVAHGDDADPAVRLDGVVRPDRAEAVYRFTQLTTGQTYPAAPVRLPGLDPSRVYRVTPLAPCLGLADPANPAGIANGQSALGWWTADGVRMTGEALERYGVRPPSLHPAQAVLFRVVAE